MTERVGALGLVLDLVGERVPDLGPSGARAGRDDPAPRLVAPARPADVGEPLQRGGDVPALGRLLREGALEPVPGVLLDELPPRRAGRRLVPAKGQGLGERSASSPTAARARRPSSASPARARTRAISCSAWPRAWSSGIRSAVPRANSGLACSSCALQTRRRTAAIRLRVREE